MKTNLSSKIFNFSRLVAIGIGFVEITTLAQAGYVVTLSEVGSDVVAIGRGSISLRGLTFDVTTRFEDGFPGFIVPDKGTIFTGPEGLVATLDQYSGFTGPTSFGSGTLTSSSFGSGAFVGIFGPIAHFPSNTILVPHEYRGHFLSDRMTFRNATFDSLGVTPGIYEWTWGTGANQTFTVRIGNTFRVPDHVSTAGLLLLGLAALITVNRLRLVRLA